MDRLSAAFAEIAVAPLDAEDAAAGIHGRAKVGYASFIELGFPYAGSCSDLDRVGDLQKRLSIAQIAASYLQQDLAALFDQLGRSLNGFLGGSVSLREKFSN
jgi:hypothetical protein